MLMEPSTAYLSISASSLSEKCKLSSAFTQSTTCSGRLAPINAELTRPFLKTQANAICANVCSLRLAISLRSEEHTSELQSRENLVCRLLLEKKKQTI